MNVIITNDDVIAIFLIINMYATQETKKQSLRELQLASFMSSFHLHLYLYLIFQVFLMLYLQIVHSLVFCEDD